MIPFYIVCVLWILTLFAWQLREKQSAKERMETLALFRAQSLSEFSAHNRPPIARPQNFLKESIGKAYADLLGDDDG